MQEWKQNSLGLKVSRAADDVYSLTFQYLPPLLHAPSPPQTHSVLDCIKANGISSPWWPMELPLILPLVSHSFG